VFFLHANATRFVSCSRFVFSMWNKVTKQRSELQASAQCRCKHPMVADSSWEWHETNLHHNSIQLKHFPAASMGCSQIQDPTEAPPAARWWHHRRSQATQGGVCALKAHGQSPHFITYSMASIHLSLLMHSLFSACTISNGRI